MPEVPYYTNDNEDEWCGHIWQQRDRIGGQWGFAWEVLEPFTNEQPVAFGWRATQEQAEKAMNEALARHKY
jgi:hypothetical protein